MFRYDSDRLKVNEKLGKGRFGTVFPYQKDPQDHKWVVKRIRAEDCDELVTCLPEIVFGFSCDHPRLVPVKGYFIEKEKMGYNVYMKLPRMKETLLSDFKERKKNCTPYSEQEIICHLYSLASGLEFLHSKKIYHGDIRHDNLLLDEQGNLMIADVGIAKHVEEEDSYQTLAGPIGTYQYLAPEILGKKTTKEVLPKADVWSVGVVILELCEFTFGLLNCTWPRDQLQTTLNGLFKNLYGKFQDSLLILIQRLLDLDPKARPDIGEVKAELEKNFPQILEKELLNVGNRNLTQVIQELQMKIQEASKYEFEAKQSKENYSQLEQQLLHQRQQHEDQMKVLVGQRNSKAREEPRKEEAENLLLQEKIKVMVQELDHLKAERQIQLETIAKLEEKLQQLRQEKTDHEQRRNELEKYFNTTVKNQMKAYEAEIKALRESQRKEKAQYDQEKKKLLKDLNTLRLQMEELEIPKVEIKRESSEEDYGKSLLQVVSDLDIKWRESFKFDTVDNKLLRTFPARDFNKEPRLFEERMAEMSNDLIETLEKNNLFNLFGLEMTFSNCLTDKSLAPMTKALSNRSLHLHLQHLNLTLSCPSLTEKAFTDLATTITSQSLQLQYLTLNLSNCPGFTDRALADLSKALSNQFLHLQHLSLNFTDNVELTDKAIEGLAAAIANQSLQLQHLSLNFAGCRKLTDKAAADVANVVSESLYLQNLVLQFDRCQLTDKALENMFKAFFNQNSPLQDIRLILTDIPRFTDTGAESLFKAAEKSGKYVQALTVNFSCSPQVQNKITNDRKESLRRRLAAHVKTLNIS